MSLMTDLMLSVLSVFRVLPVGRFKRKLVCSVERIFTLI